MAANLLCLTNFGPSGAYAGADVSVVDGDGVNEARYDHIVEPFDAYASLVAARVSEVRERIAQALASSGRKGPVRLVAVTKTYGAQAVLAAAQAGVLDVGENKVQEAESKMEEVSAPVRWHLIGHLQRNKARGAVRFDVVQSLDSERLAAALNDAALAAGKVQDVLVQVNVSGEDTKGGVSPAEVSAFGDALHGCPGLRVAGVMTMAPFDAPDAVLRSVFRGAHALRDGLIAGGHPAHELSMGMSGDFEVAVQEGATLVRLGTVLFGKRASS
jgi:pyridoxal phosphate enzyme (YggS family)